MRNYSWKNKIVVDYNTQIKNSLHRFFDSVDGMGLLEEIQETFVQIQTENRNISLFKKYNREISAEDIDFILFKS